MGSANGIKKVLFVCIGNVCRSPVAAALFNKDSSKMGLFNWYAISAGLAPAVSVVPRSVKVAREFGIDTQCHIPKVLTSEMLDDADLTLVMTPSLKELPILRMHKQVYTLGEYTLTGESVEDPFGEDIDTYRATYRQLERLIRLVIQRLLRSTGSS